MRDTVNNYQHLDVHLMAHKFTLRSARALLVAEAVLEVPQATCAAEGCR